MTLNQQQQPPASQGQLGSKVALALAKAEARRQKRLARQAEVCFKPTRPAQLIQVPKKLLAVAFSVEDEFYLCSSVFKLSRISTKMLLKIYCSMVFTSDSF